MEKDSEGTRGDTGRFAPYSWRLLNVLVVLAGMTAPWFVIPSDLLPGLQESISGWRFVVNLAIATIRPPPIDIWPLRVRDGLTATGGIFIGIYCVANLVLLFQPWRNNKPRGWHVALLGSGILGSLVLVQPFDPISGPPLWGYWMTCLGMLSSVALEAIDLYHH
jgi:hypothetical protein